jgi:hypothetical protein
VINEENIDQLYEDAKNESRQAVEELIDIVQSNEDIKLRRLAWQKLEGIYYATSESFAEWADKRVMQRGARYP